jgi:hypothetical protein
VNNHLSALQPCILPIGSGEFHLEYVRKKKAATRLSKMHAKAPKCFNFFNFHPVSTKFPMNIEHIIPTNRMFFVFGIATFWCVNYVTNLVPKH